MHVFEATGLENASADLIERAAEPGLDEAERAYRVAMRDTFNCFVRGHQNDNPVEAAASLMGILSAVGSICVNGPPGGEEAIISVLRDYIAVARSLRRGAA
jgi:hypothetical protein